MAGTQSKDAHTAKSVDGICDRDVLQRHVSPCVMILFKLVLHGFCGYFVRATYCMNFNWFNFVQRLAETKSVSLHTGRHVAIPCPLGHVPATVSRCVYYKLWFCPWHSSLGVYNMRFLSLRHAPAACPRVATPFKKQLRLDTEERGSGQTFLNITCIHRYGRGSVAEWSGRWTCNPEILV